MLFLLHLIYTIAFLGAIIYACALFTNAIEHLGCKLKLGNNAVGSVLAVVGTTLPETIVPLIAIFGALILKEDIVSAQNIALGAIIGSPFMLSTLALFLLGVVLLIKKRKYLNVDYKSVLRDYKYFLFAYIVAISATIIPYKSLKIIVALFLIGFYAVFITRTIKQSKENFCENELDELIFSKLFKRNLVFSQVIISLLVLIIFSHLFIEEIKYFSFELNINPLILSLFITPFATELPECVNSIIWIKDNKDDLAIANVLGAIVFQAIIPMSIGIILTPWKFDNLILINILSVILCAIVFYLLIYKNKKINLFMLFIAGGFYFAYLIYVLFNTII